MPQLWTTLFQLNHTPLATENLQDISQDLADRAPAPDVHSVTWILSHVIEFRRWMLEAILKSEYRPSLVAPKTLPQLLEALDESQGALAAAFDDVEDWDAPMPHPGTNQPSTLEAVVGTLFMHEAYHLGQLGVARRLLGLPGAIKSPAERAAA